VNDPAALAVFAIPEAANGEADKAIAAGDYSPVTITKINDGVYFARAYSHNSLVVEFPSYLAVSKRLTRMRRAPRWRGCSPRSSQEADSLRVVTHYHYDHSGGVRGLAAWAPPSSRPRSTKPMVRPIVEAPHTNPADALELARKAGTAGALELFEGKKVISDGGRRWSSMPSPASRTWSRRCWPSCPGRRAVPERSVLPGHGAPRAGRRGAAAGGEGAEAAGDDARRRARRRRSGRGAGESRRANQRTGVSRFAELACAGRVSAPLQ
jgi:hypothetical protein